MRTKMSFTLKIKRAPSWRKKVGKKISSILFSNNNNVIENAELLNTFSTNDQLRIYIFKDFGYDRDKDSIDYRSICDNRRFKAEIFEESTVDITDKKHFELISFLRDIPKSQAPASPKDIIFLGRVKHYGYPLMVIRETKGWFTVRIKHRNTSLLTKATESFLNDALLKIEYGGFQLSGQLVRMLERRAEDHITSGYYNRTIFTRLIRQNPAQFVFVCLYFFIGSIIVYARYEYFIFDHQAEFPFMFNTADKVYGPVAVGAGVALLQFLSGILNRRKGTIIWDLRQASGREA